MAIVIDTSAIIAVLVDAPERDKIIALTTDHRLIGPGSIPWEIGNAFSAMLKRNRLELAEAQQGLALFKQMEITFVEVDFSQVLTLAKQSHSYAYDVYFLDCAIRCNAPLLTLDQKLKNVAQSLGIETLEI